MTILVDEERDHSRSILIAVVDGKAEHRAQVTKALTSFYRVAEYGNGNEALHDLATTPPAVILVDQSVPPAGAQNFVQNLRKMPEFKGVHVICTAHANQTDFFRDAKGFGADACLEKPFRRSILIKTISGLVNKAVEAGWTHLPQAAQKTLRQTVDAFNGISDLIERGEPLEYNDVSGACGPLVEAVTNADYKAILANVRGHDNYSYVHSLRVATLLSLFGHTIGLKGDDLLLLASGGLVHDIGKMNIPHEVLNKPGKLSDDEWGVMRSHVPRTVDYLSTCEVPKGVITIASQHHEKLNGTGYPNGLKGGELNELARMASIVDVFSALTDRRVYKPPMEPEKALKIMTEEMSDGLDQSLLALFKHMLIEAAS